LLFAAASAAARLCPPCVAILAGRVGPGEPHDDGKDSERSEADEVDERRLCEILRSAGGAGGGMIIVAGCNSDISRGVDVGRRDVRGAEREERCMILEMPRPLKRADCIEAGELLLDTNPESPESLCRCELAMLDGAVFVISGIPAMRRS
jgi:hypothetical protein